jgi:hypothetical protein
MKPSIARGESMPRKRFDLEAASAPSGVQNLQVVGGK